LISARKELEDSITYYLSASDFIRNHRPAGNNGNLVTLDPTMAANEAKLRVTMQDTLAGLNSTVGPSTIKSPDGIADVTLDFEKMFDSNNPVDIRSLLPQFTCMGGQNGIIHSSWPDTTLGGVFVGMVVHRPLSIMSVNATPVSPVGVGVTTTWSVTFTGGSGSQEYRFLRSGPDTGGVYVVARDWSSTPTWGWTTTAAATGNNYVQVKVRNSDLTDSTGLISTKYTVSAPLSITTLYSSPALPVTAGANVGWNALAAGGTGSYQYSFWRQGPDTGGVYVKFQDWGTSTNWVWTTTAANIGNNYIMVKARNSNLSGTAVSKISTMYKVYAALTVTSLTATKVSPVNVGDGVTWNSAATGGKGTYLYSYWRQGPDTGGVYVLQRDWTSSYGWTWTPAVNQVGNNYVMVKVKNSDSSGTAVYKISAKFVVQSALTPIVIDSITPNAASGVSASSIVTWTAHATGGSGSYQYQFLRSGPDTPGYAVMQDWSSASSFNWYTNSANIGNNYIQVKVRNAVNGTGAVSKISTMFQIK